ncbi:LOW QUALITY PROTEIN: hypothetical protein, conserved [Eimeria necatrix]|uniref:Uncharacterized protein n=1 Tax=Eimeria necatrix TaxID=51315 RepID=U6MN11_9EIME|nr:LOW QUALITY PROTEIN: hypothetical protein, conserved [Eimeria necatrix]CDJ63864.1 hypothetical protein, conserved [Eimeria necatrix]
MLHQPTAPCTSPPLAAAKSLEVKKIFFFKNWRNKRINCFLCTRPNSWPRSSPSQPHQKPGPVAGGAAAASPQLLLLQPLPGPSPGPVSAPKGPWGPLGPPGALGGPSVPLSALQGPPRRRDSPDLCCCCCSTSCPSRPQGPPRCGAQRGLFCCFLNSKRGPACEDLLPGGRGLQQLSPALWGAATAANFAAAAAASDCFPSS